MAYDMDRLDPTSVELFDAEQFVFHAENIPEEHRETLLWLFTNAMTRQGWKKYDEQRLVNRQLHEEIAGLRREIKQLKQALSDEVGTRCNLERRLMDVKGVVAETLAQIGASNAQ